MEGQFDGRITMAIQAACVAASCRLMARSGEVDEPSAEALGRAAARYSERVRALLGEFSRRRPGEVSAGDTRPGLGGLFRTDG